MLFLEKHSYKKYSKVDMCDGNLSIFKHILLFEGIIRTLKIISWIIWFYILWKTGAVCSYDDKKDCLVPDLEKSHPKTCAFCNG